MSYTFDGLEIITLHDKIGCLKFSKHSLPSVVLISTIGTPEINLLNISCALRLHTSCWISLLLTVSAELLSLLLDY